MQAPNPWPRFIRQLLILAVPFVLLGVIFGYLWLATLLLLLMILGWHLRHLYQLETWIREGRKLDPPMARGIWGVIFDGIYRQRRRQRNRYKKLQKLTRRYRDSAKAMPDAVVVLRKDFRIDWWNQAAADLLGLTWPADERQRIGNIYRHPAFLDFLDDLDASGGVITLPSPVDDSITLEIRVIRYGKRQYLLLARDVSRVQRLETMRRDFVANVSHELRTPLTVVYGVAETLAEELAEEPELAGSARLLRQQSERMKALVEDLLMLSRLETATAPPPDDVVNVSPMLQDLRDDALALAAESRHEVLIDTAAEMGLLGSEAEIRSAFSNLVFNAIRHTPAGSSVRIGWEVNNSGGHFSVSDNGPGIPPHHQARLTERFYRVDDGRSRGRGGTGLGLAIVKHVLMRHGGRLEIQSLPGKGSTFLCHFPKERLCQSDLPNTNPAMGQSA